MGSFFDRYILANLNRAIETKASKAFSSLPTAHGR